MENLHKTHKIFFQAITENKLNELLKRADPKEMILENHINSLLTGTLSCKVKLHRTKTYNNIQKAIIISYCDIYIEYYDNNNNIGHLSLHLKSDDKNIKLISKQNGRLHIKNVNETCYTLKCNKRKNPNRNNSVSFSITRNKFIKPKLDICIAATIDTLNLYFELDGNNDWSLDNRLTKYPMEKHKCLYPILIHFSKKKHNTIRKTIKHPSKF